jgi:hypothetical protein
MVWGDGYVEDLTLVEPTAVPRWSGHGIGAS